MDKPLYIELFGNLVIRTQEGVMTHFPTRKTAELFAYLAVYSDRAHTREMLTGLLWPEHEWDVTRHRLNQAISSLRRMLTKGGIDPTDLLLANHVTVQLNPKMIQTDVHQFQSLLAQSDAASNAKDGLALKLKAFDVYKEDFLPGFYEEWILVERQRLSDTHLSTLYEAVQLLRDADDSKKAVQLAKRALAVDPVSEDAHMALIQLYIQDGQISLATKQFKEMGRIMEENLGEGPSPESQKFYKRLLNAHFEVRKEGVEVRPSVSHVMRRPKLPASLNSFFGREKEIEEIRHVLLSRGVRVITITGTGGSGKTRLAVEASTRIASDLDNAVCFVPYADIEEPNRIYEAILVALGVSATKKGEQLEQIAAYLESVGPALLVLDNFEQLVQAGTPMIRELMERVPQLLCLVTSRQKLNLEGEYELALKPLVAPAQSQTLEQLKKVPSVQLFVDRAQSVRPDFKLTEANAEALRLLSRKLEGIPLAIELAASWIHTLSPGQMLTELSKRFDLLVSRRKDVIPRHRALRATIEDSYVRLPKEVKNFLHCLSVFSGGWTLESASGISGSAHSRDHLRMLIERSLITSDGSKHEDWSSIRFKMLDTIREYVLEQIPSNELERLKRKHAQVFFDFAVEAQKHFVGPDQASWYTRADEDYLNLFAALDWYLDNGQTAEGLEMAIALGMYWEVRGHMVSASNVVQKLIGALPQAAENDLLMLRSYSMLGRLALFQGDLPQAEKRIGQAMDLREKIADVAFEAELLCNRGILSLLQQQHEDAGFWLKESLAMCEKTDDVLGKARALVNLGTVAMRLNDCEQSEEYYKGALKYAREMEDPQNCAKALNNLGALANLQNKYDLASFYFRESEALEKDLGRLIGIAIARTNVAIINFRLGNWENTREAIQESLEIYMELGSSDGLSDCFMITGHLAALSGQHESAAKLWGAASCYENSEVVDPEIWQSTVDALGKDLMQAAHQTGAAMPTHQIAELAFDCLSAFAAKDKSA